MLRVLNLSGLNQLFFLMGMVFFVSAVTASEGKSPGFAKQHDGYADAATCLGCHSEEAKAWSDSDHDWAMREATAQTVLGDFNDARFEDAGFVVEFFKKNNTYIVRTEGEDGKATDFNVRYTFGFDPLQQYLIEFPGGRLQSLTVAWDSRPKEAGGQRWFSMYPGQRFAPSDPLHWTGRYQNWNAMCADCHSTNVLKNYNDQTDTYTTTWHEQNVGCQACHGPGKKHAEWASEIGKVVKRGSIPLKDMGLPVDFKALGSQGLVEQCGYCHSRNQSLGVGQQHGKPLLDAVLPTTLQSDLYHADGQIEAEVYVYGSFTQSKMYAAGVSCIDCHNPHTTKLKVDGNGLCLQCHSEAPPKKYPNLIAKNYESAEHHHHAQDSTGAQCVNCHMPAQTYMQVDPRRDHSFRIPRPDLNAQTSSPDACTACHAERSPEWAAKAIVQWFGDKQRSPHYGQAFQAVREGHSSSVALLANIIQDIKLPAIVRASAVEQLGSLPSAPSFKSLSQALKDENSLVRAYAVSGFLEQATTQQVMELVPLLKDPALAVRDEALRALAGFSETSLPLEYREALTQGLVEYEQRLRGNADLPGNRLNLGVLLERQQRYEEAFEQYYTAIRIDPYFSPALVNLVLLANNLQRQDDAEEVLREAMSLKRMPAADRGNLAYMLALLLVEKGQFEEGVKWIAEAAAELPDNSRIHYNHGLLLLQLKRPEAARKALDSGLLITPEDPDLLYALIYLQLSTGQDQDALENIERFRKVAPNDSRLGKLNIKN